MARILAIRRRLEEERESLGWKEQLEVFQKRSAALKAKFAAMDLVPSYNTPMMEEVIARRAERLAAGHGHHTPDPSDDEEDGDEVDHPPEVRKGPGVTFKPGDVMTPGLKTSTRRLRSQASSTSSSKVKKSSIKTKSRANTPVEEEAMDTDEASEVFSKTPEDPRSRQNDKTTCQTEPMRRTRRCRATPSPIGQLTGSVNQSEARTTRSCRSTPPLTAPSTLPTPSDTAPPSPPSLSSRHVTCPVCSKILLEKSLPRHLASIHKMRTASTNEKAGVTTADQSEVSSTPCSQRRSGRKRSSPNVIDHDQEPRRLKSAMTDSPAGNLRMTGCPLCGLQMAKSLIPKHFQVDSQQFQTTTFNLNSMT